jgi:hypothetical protein
MFGTRKTEQLYLSLLAVVLVLALLSACTPPVDSDIGTDSIHASMDLKCIGDGTTTVDVILSAGGASGADIYLTNGDRLNVTANGQSQLLAEERDWPYTVRYLAALDIDDPGTLVQISLERSGPDYISAPNSTVTLPDNIMIQSPQPDEVFNRLRNIFVSWEPSGVSDEMIIKFDITCTADQDVSGRDLSYPVSDSGSDTYRVDDLLNEWELADNASCTAEVTLTRLNIGSLSAEFRSGEITAQREASVLINITP